MKAVIKLTNGFGKTEFYAESGGYTPFLMDAHIFQCEDIADDMIRKAKSDGSMWASIWKSATVQPIRIVEA